MGVSETASEDLVSDAHLDITRGRVRGSPGVGLRVSTVSAVFQGLDFLKAKNLRVSDINSARV
jgi:hypothetical protein